MKKLILTGLIALSLSACAKPSASQRSMDWSNMGGGQVAKVNNIKSLISPGFY